MQGLAGSGFLPSNLKRSLSTKLANDKGDAVRYFPYQIQNDAMYAGSTHFYFYTTWLDHRTRGSTPTNFGLKIRMYFSCCPQVIQSHNGLAAVEIPGTLRKIDHHHMEIKRLLIKLINYCKRICL